MTTPSECGVAQGQRWGTKGLRESGVLKEKRDFFLEIPEQMSAVSIGVGLISLISLISPASQGTGAVPVGMQLDGEGMRGEV